MPDSQRQSSFFWAGILIPREDGNCPLAVPWVAFCDIATFSDVAALGVSFMNVQIMCVWCVCDICVCLLPIWNVLNGQQMPNAHAASISHETNPVLSGLAALTHEVLFPRISDVFRSENMGVPLGKKWWPWQME